jgi:myo-inositol-1(or 4)-monophosphatase
MSQPIINDTLRAELIGTAEALADAAGAAILPHFRRYDLTSDNKLDGGFDPVTIADRDAEAAMRALLAELRPEDAILGEEFGPKSGTSGLTWVLDPIDGTRGFISGTPTWGVLIAVGGPTGPLLGVIDQPYTAERFVGGLGEVRMTGPAGRRTLRTRDTAQLAQAILFTTFPEVGSKTEGAAFAALSAGVKLTRYGMDCYAYALVAAGQIDLVVEAGLQPYDIQAPLAVIEAAGGIVTDWQGGPAHMGGRVLAAANAGIHAEALKVLREF